MSIVALIAERLPLSIACMIDDYAESTTEQMEYVKLLVSHEIRMCMSIPGSNMDLFIKTWYGLMSLYQAYAMYSHDLLLRETGIDHRGMICIPKMNIRNGLTGRCRICHCRIAIAKNKCKYIHLFWGVHQAQTLHYEREFCRYLLADQTLHEWDEEMIALRRKLDPWQQRVKLTKKRNKTTKSSTK